jgi:hypothetical protein
VSAPRSIVDAVRRRVRGGDRPPAADVSGKRYSEGRVPTPFVEPLSDDDLQTLNQLLPWQCFTVDSHGRAFGRAAWAGKRVDPQAVPDPRIVAFDERFGLDGKTVLEVGCFEGVHTTALCKRGAEVIAIDARIENVVKTIVRCSFFGVAPTVFTFDLEESKPPPRPLDADLLHHVGVLYHLTDPVGHLRQLCDSIAQGIMLDTHYALPDQATDSYDAGGRTYRYKRFEESGRDDAFSGMREHAKWLLLDDLVALLESIGFGAVEIVEKRDERNGPRVLLYAER